MKKRKRLLTAVLAATLITCISACGKPQVNNNTEQTGSTTASETASETTQEIITTTMPMETTVDRNIMPNTAGLVILGEEETTSSKLEIIEGLVPDEIRGINNNDDFFSADGDMERLGVTKKVVFQCMSHNTSSLDPVVLSKFNELLVKKYGCDFVLELVGIENWYYISAYVDGKWVKYGYTYLDTVSDMKNMGQRVDIITAIGDADYTKLAEEGYFVDITDYLTDDAEGKKLYDAYPAEIWEMVKRNGRIYGYTTYSTPMYMYTLNCNKKMADRLGLKVEEGFSFYDMGTILAEAGISSEELGDVAPIYVGSGYAYAMLDCIELGCGLMGRKDAKGNWTAFNPTEDEGFLKLWKTIRDYRKKGWLADSSTGYRKVTEGDFLFACNTFSGADMVDDKILLRRTEGRNDIKEIFDIIPGDIRYGYYGPRDNVVYGVTAWSEYKDEALRLITLMQTEPELANLLRYGIEGVHHVYEDNKVTLLPSLELKWGADSGSMNLLNPNITYSVDLEPENKLEFYKVRSANYEKDPRLDCGISTQEYYDLYDPYEERVDILDQICEQGYAKLLNGEYEDVEAAASEINRMQKEAGIDEITDALNERFGQKEAK
ncbi:MAG: extracellular solute-binding protein [Lachnospiraceae bacterium]|nr:extracellular solute-binding protein [Lachnospiraceae bacterium]